LSEGLSLNLGPDAIEAIAKLVAEKLRPEESSPGQGWFYLDAAAAYLGVPVSRLEKDRTLPRHRWKGRVIYSRAELDAYLQGLGST
jgi:hypothetical protein